MVGNIPAGIWCLSSSSLDNLVKGTTWIGQLKCCIYFYYIGFSLFDHSVNLFVSQSLITARFCSTSLVSLSLAGCRAVTILELTCPSLQQVCLDGCDHLERASFCPVRNLTGYHS